MKKIKLFTTLFIAVALSSTAFAQTQLEQFNTHLDNLASQLNKVIPNAATEQNVYSDAWIGNFFPSVPMHFAAGIEFGLTKFDISELKEAANTLHISSVPNTLLYPTIGVNGKIGGFFLPFDVGFSFFTLDTSKMGNLLNGVNLNLFVIGGNFRYAILQGKGPLPKVSIGVGYYYSNGALGTNSNDSSIQMKYETQTLVAEAQVSKKLIFVTPFLGFRGIFVKSTTDYNWKSTINLGESASPTYSGSGSQSVDFSKDFIPQVFGGVGLSLGLIQLDTNASYDFKNDIWNGGISVRFKL